MFSGLPRSQTFRFSVTQTLALRLSDSQTPMLYEHAYVHNRIGLSDSHTLGLSDCQIQFSLSDFQIFSRFSNCQILVKLSVFPMFSKFSHCQILFSLSDIQICSRLSDSLTFRLSDSQTFRLSDTQTLFLRLADSQILIFSCSHTPRLQTHAYIHNRIGLSDSQPLRLSD